MPETKETLDQMAGEIFELYKLVAIARSRRPAGHADLSETEYLTLDTLSYAAPLTIGEVQKRIGVVPAQMSRIVRALEEKDGKGFVACSINKADRRRIDISLTTEGRAALDAYRTSRLGSMHEILKVLGPKDRLEFMRMLREIRRAFEGRLAPDTAVTRH